MSNDVASIPVPRPAATVMLLRDGASGLEVYLVRRSARARFMPGVYVFPGGAIDREDGEPAALRSLRGVAPADAAAAVAAARELFEEAGVLLACDGAGEPVELAPETLAAMRAELASGAPFGAALERRGLALDASALVAYSNWITPEREPIRFDVRFFVARAPAGQIALADALETHDGTWIAPREALERDARGTLRVPFPTRAHLERLAAFPDVATAVERSRGRPIRAVTPLEGTGGRILFASGDEAW